MGKIFALLIPILVFSQFSHAQNVIEVPGADTMPPMPSYEERAKKWGPNDTIIRAAVWYNREMMTYAEMENLWVSKLSPAKLAEFIAAYNRLRNAVYVTYPYARIAGATINGIQDDLKNVTNKKERRIIIKKREKQLKEQFTEPLKNLSVYQGRVLMKLINRETGNNCFEILKEFKGGFNASMYQTVAFFFGGNLKQEWHLKNTEDRQIEAFVQEIHARWYGSHAGSPYN